MYPHGPTSTTTVACKFSGTLTLFQPGGQILPTVGAIAYKFSLWLHARGTFKYYVSTGLIRLGGWAQKIHKVMFTEYLINLNWSISDIFPILGWFLLLIFPILWSLFLKFFKHFFKKHNSLFIQ